MAITVSSGMIYGVKINLEFETYDGELEDIDPDDETEDESDDREKSPWQVEREKSASNKISWVKIKQLAEDVGLYFDSDESRSSSNYVDAAYVGVNVQIGSSTVEIMKQQFEKLYTPQIAAEIKEFVRSEVEISKPGLFSTYAAYE